MLKQDANFDILFFFSGTRVRKWTSKKFFFIRYFSFDFCVMFDSQSKVSMILTAALETICDELILKVPV